MCTNQHQPTPTCKHGAYSRKTTTLTATAMPVALSQHPVLVIDSACAAQSAKKHYWQAAGIHTQHTALSKHMHMRWTLR
jgi:dihydroorotase